MLSGLAQRDVGKPLAFPQADRKACLVPAEAVADLLADVDACYRVVSSRDDRWDGRLYLGVVTTGVYCRPSCPARTPLPPNCRYYSSSAAAVAAGFRACRRCRPDALPGTRDDDARADLAARALRLIRDGVVDGEGVSGLARRLHVSDRHLQRVLMAEVGAGPLRLASSRRAQTARLLIEQSSLPLSDVAFAAGFASIRQFNDVMRAEFGCTPSDLRRHRLADAARGPDEPGAGGERRPVPCGLALPLVLRYREPYASDKVWGYLQARLIPGVERLEGESLVRRLPARRDRARKSAEVAVSKPRDGRVRLRLELADLSGLGEMVASVRRWLDLDADPGAVDAVLARDAALSPLVEGAPGMRVPGTVDGFELAVRAIVGQQVSVAGARTLLGRLAAAIGSPGQMPDAVQVAAAGMDALTAAGLTRRRAATITALAESVVLDKIALDAGADRHEMRARLLAVPGIGPWTATYVALRAWGDPDAWPATDLVLARRVTAAALDPTRWRPWRGYAAMHLWTAAAPSTSGHQEAR